MAITPTTTELSPVEKFERWTHMLGRAQQLLMEHWTVAATAATKPAAAMPAVDPLGVWADWSRALMTADPAKLVAAQTAFVTDSLKLWSSLLGGQPEEAPVTDLTANKDKRFAGAAWHEPAFDIVRRSYLLVSEHAQRFAAVNDTLSDHERAKLAFHTRQFTDAMSPSNFLATNPEAWAAAEASGGETLVKGLEHMLADMQTGKLTMTDETAFEVGVNVAATPGKVVFENRMFQLIQYAPTTEEVFATPLLIYPPWINKFYILDLTPEKSFIRYAVAAGYTVFIVSWANAGPEHADVTLDTYVREGMLEALDRVLEASAAPSAHTIGYCVAGTTLAATLAYLTARGEAERVASATFFTAQVDFEDAGDLKVFIDDAQLKSIETMTAQSGVTSGRAMATTFNMLRSNDLMWSYVVNNYLKGKDYYPFDLLYWNSDATNVPAKWHLEYLRDMYRDNKLNRPNAITVLGTPIDLTTVATPTYIQAGREDHIAPAKSVWKMAHLFTGPLRFVLAGSGHIAGVVNPPAAGKYQHWVSDTAELPATFDQFIAAAREVKGSWWPDWLAWLAPRSGDKVPARTPGDGPLKAIEDAPGRYVKVRA